MKMKKQMTKKVLKKVNFMSSPQKIASLIKDQNLNNLKDFEIVKLLMKRLQVGPENQELFMDTFSFALK